MDRVVCSDTLAGRLRVEWLALEDCAVADGLTFSSSDLYSRDALPISRS